MTILLPGYEVGRLKQRLQLKRGRGEDEETKVKEVTPQCIAQRKIPYNFVVSHLYRECEITIGVTVLLMILD